MDSNTSGTDVVLCWYGGDCPNVATYRVTQYNAVHRDGHRMPVCTEHRDALTANMSRYVSGWGEVLCEVALLRDEHDQPTRLEVIVDAATRMLHGNDYENPQSQLRVLAAALGVDPADVEALS